MKVFISWSGDLSKNVAQLLREWLGNVLQFVEPWMSASDIEKGSVWFGDISRELSNDSFGLLCITRENMTAPWVLFEAGALFKGLGTNRVCPILIDLPATDLKPPLSQFNAAQPNRDDMCKLVASINSSVADDGLPEAKLHAAFERWWDVFEGKLRTILEAGKPSNPPPSRSTEDMVVEVLHITREIQKTLIASTSAPSVMYGSSGTSGIIPSGSMGTSGSSGYGFSPFVTSALVLGKSGAIVKGLAGETLSAIKDRVFRTWAPISYSAEPESGGLWRFEMETRQVIPRDLLRQIFSDVGGEVLDLYSRPG